MHVSQSEAKGLGHALLKAHPIIGDEPFVVILPDVILDEYGLRDQNRGADFRANLVQLLAQYPAT